MNAKEQQAYIDSLPPLSEELMAFIEAHNDRDLPDGAWRYNLESAVHAWNKKHRTRLDPSDTIHVYLWATRDSIPQA